MALEALYPNRLEFDTMVTLRLGKSLDQIVAAGADLSVAYFHVSQWSHTNGRFADFVNAVWEDRGQPPSWKALHDEFNIVQAGVPSATCPWDAWRLGEDEVFLAREALRNALREIHGGGSRRVLVVHGDHHSGKTYSHELIKHVARTYGHNVVWVDLVDSFGLRGEPLALAQTLLLSARLSTADMPGHAGNEPDKITPLSAFVIGKLRELRGTWWFVLDRCSRQSLSDGVWTLALRIAAGVANNLSNVNVVLLGYDEPIVSPLKSAARTERIAALDVADLAKFFRTELGGARPSLDPEIDREAQEALRGVIGTEEDPVLAQISRRAIAALARLKVAS
jgi:hypothetical protein